MSEWLTHIVKCNALVVRPKKDDVVWHSHAIVIVSFHLFVCRSKTCQLGGYGSATSGTRHTEGPNLWDGRDVRRVEHIRQQLPLVSHDLLKKIDIFALRERHCITNAALNTANVSMK